MCLQVGTYILYRSRCHTPILFYAFGILEGPKSTLKAFDFFFNHNS